MKHIGKLVATVVAVTALTFGSAAAANFTHCADALKSMDLFRGTSVGYDLDRKPTRAQAATMLVRLLGKEAEAAKLSYSAPFTDVPTWAQPYVQYLYQNGLAKGTSATTFSSLSDCTAQQYATFLLRALGYTEENGDFTYSNALSAASSAGIANSYNCNTTNFLRDHVVAMSYTTLSREPANGKYDTLLDQLIASGAINSTNAAATKTLFTHFNEYANASIATQSQTKVALTTSSSLSMKHSGIVLLSREISSNIKYDLNTSNPNQSKFSSSESGTAVMNAQLASQYGVAAKQTQQLERYYTNGYYYEHNKTKGTKQKTAANYADIGVGTTISTDPICAIKSIVVSNTTDGSGKIYKITYAIHDTKNLLSGIQELIDIGSSSTTINSMVCQYTVKNGMISAQSNYVDLTAALGNSLSVGMILSTLSTVTATGNAVTVTLPSDLDSYKAVQSLSAS